MRQRLRDSLWLIVCLQVSIVATLPSSVASQTTSAEDCVAILEDLRWLLIEGQPSGLLASDHAGASLVGVACEPNAIKNWFSDSNWRFRGEAEFKPDQSGPFGPPGKEYYQDRVLSFCAPRHWFMQWVMGSCSMGVAIFMYEGRITHISAGAFQ